MTGDSVECFNCGRSNPSWAQVCRSCGVPMRPGGAGARPPSGPFPTDRDSLVSIGAALGTMAVAILIGLLLSGMLPEAAAVIDTPTPQPSVSVLPSGSGAATPSAEESAPPEKLPGKIALGYGLNRSTMHVTNPSHSFARGQSFCHSVSLPTRFNVSKLHEEILKVEDNGDLTVVQRRGGKDGVVGPIDPNARVVGFCAQADWLIDGVGDTEGWGTGNFLLRDYRVRGNGPELLAQHRFTLTD
jgi:hypothetical protein